MVQVIKISMAILFGIVFAYAVINISNYLLIKYTLNGIAEIRNKRALEKRKTIKLHEQTKLDEKLRLKNIAIQEQKILDKANYEAKRKKIAWNEWFKTQQSEKCKNWKYNEVLTECVNEKIRKKSSFNKIWKNQNKY